MTTTHVAQLSRPVAAPIVARLLARAPHLHTRLGRGIVRDRAAIAADPDCPTDILDLLADDRPTVVLAVAGNPHCPPGALARIIDSLHTRPWHTTVTETYLAALSNVNCPVETMRKMLHFHAETVLSNPSCPLDLALEASRSEWPYLRLAAVRYHPLPSSELVRLTSDRDSTTAWEARIALLDRDTEAILAAIRSASTSHRSWFFRILSEQQLCRLAEDPDPWMRRGAARNTANRELLRRLADDTNGHVRRAATLRFMEILG